MNSRITLALVTAVLGLTATATPVAAANPRVVVSGLGSYSLTGSSAAAYEADVHGRPYSGPATGQVELADKPFPSPGNCEPATATLRVTDDRGRAYALTATGQVCGEYLPLGVMQRFQGRYAITSASQRGLVGTVGHVDLRLLNGEVSVYAIQS
jgi:hypothetical protein